MGDTRNIFCLCHCGCGHGDDQFGKVSSSLRPLEWEVVRSRMVLASADLFSRREVTGGRALVTGSESCVVAMWICCFNWLHRFHYCGRRWIDVLFLVMAAWCLFCMVLLLLFS